MTTTQTTSPTTATVQPTVSGIHHVTAITGDAQANIDFYTKTLGLRMVKITVNYDDPSSYHLYYGDGLGRPGTILTFFAWPGARRGHTGTGQVSETAYAVPVGALDYWEDRLVTAGILELDRTTRFGEETLAFRDPEGLALALVATADARDTHLWTASAVPAQYAIRGFHGVTLLEISETGPASILVPRFGYREIGREQNRVRYLRDGDVAGRVVDVVTTPTRSFPGMGAGEVHHVAFRTPDDPQQLRWLELLLADGHRVSPVMDRNYFHSIYFREPGGTLFEIATDGPGFARDETAEELGTHLVLPPWLEPQHTAITRNLPPVKLPGPLHP